MYTKEDLKYKAEDDQKKPVFTASDVQYEYEDEDELQGLLEWANDERNQQIDLIKRVLKYGPIEVTRQNREIIKQQWEDARFK